ncbi:MAG: NHL repeat-containing protein [Vulcanimicrobiaceae bacterium]
MNNKLRNLTAGAALLLAAGCASGGSSSSPNTLPVVPAAKPSLAPGQAALTITFKVPGTSKPASFKSRAPQYISPSTQSFTLGVDGATPAPVGSCTNGTCTATVDLGAGAHTLVVKLFDAAKNELASNTAASCPVTAGVANTCTVTMYGLAKSLSILAYSYNVAGTAATGYTLLNGATSSLFSIAALDADGNQILGVGGITPSVTPPNGSITITPGTAPLFTIADTNNTTAQSIAVSATPAPNSDGVALSQSFSITGATALSSAAANIYVANYSAATITTYTSAGAQTTLGSATNPFASLNGSAGLAVDSTGNVYVANENKLGTGNVAVFGPNGGSATFTITSGLKNPDGLAVSGSNIYVSDYTNGTLTTYNTSNGHPNTSLTTAIAGLNQPDGVAVDGTTGDIFVSSYGPGPLGNVTVYNSTGSLLNTITDVSGPAGLAVYNGNLYVANFDVGTVTVYNTTTYAQATLTNPIAGLSQPDGVAIDSSGNLYVSNFASNNFDAGTLSVFNATTGAASSLANPVQNLNGPAGVAVH